MRLFVSYARVDKPYCIQIIEMLDVHEVWYDQRLYAGQQWWKEILRRLDWCEGFIYLLSPESIASEYCRREFELAVNLGRHIFPVLIHPDATVPSQIKDMQYADLRKGLTVDAVRVLLTSIYIAERHKTAPPGLPVASFSPEDTRPPQVNPATVISVAASAMERGQYDQAVFLLKQAKVNGYASRFVKIDDVLSAAETGLEKQTFLREAEREYRGIASLIKNKGTRALGCTSFAEFVQAYPDYDPDGLSQICGAPSAPVTPARLSAPLSTTPISSTTDSGEAATLVETPALPINPTDPTARPDTLPPDELDIPPSDPPATVIDAAEKAAKPAIPLPVPNILPLAAQAVPAQVEAPAPAPSSNGSIYSLPLLEWKQVDGGMITLSINEKSGVLQKHFYVDSFQMSKYPVTNGQYRAFLEAPDGYSNAEWWNYSTFAQNWRANNPEPMPSRFSGDDRPRETVTWYDAIAYTRWLSSKLDKTVSLPTSAQWQRAAQGDESRLYPWGDNFDANLANTRESNLKTTTPVTRYPDGASPFGIFDMAGNVWEWCLNTKADAESHVTDLMTTEDRAVYGGAFVSPQGRSETSFHYYLNPQTFYASLGFRLVIEE